MASRTLVSLALLISLNLLFFTLVSSCDCSPSSPPSSPPSSSPPPPPKQTPNPSPPPPPPKQTPNPSPPPSSTSPSPSPSSNGKCPRDALKLGVCANALGGLVKVALGPKHPCCTLVSGLVDLDAAVCLCTVIRGDLLGIIKLKIPIDLSVLLNGCGKSLPKGFQCP